MNHEIDDMDNLGNKEIPKGPFGLRGSGGGNRVYESLFSPLLLYLLSTLA